jgi:outer membrane protein, heavy metal efflux system
MNHSFYLLFVLLAVFLPISLPPSYLWGAQGSLSLEEITQKALARNPDLAAARAQWRMAMERIPQEAAWEDPKLSFRSLLGRFVQIPANGFTDQTVSLEQSIPLSGKNRSRQRAAAAEAVAAFQALRRQELDLVLKVRSVFFQLINEYELLELNQETETALSQIIDSVRAKFEVGAQPESDLLTAQLEDQKVTEERQNLEQKRSDNEIALKVLMSADFLGALGRPKVFRFEAVAPNTQELRSRVLLNNPALLQASARLAAAQSRYQLARREWIPDPTVSIQADHYNAGSQVASEVSGGLSISLPWLNEKKYSAGEREAFDQVAASQETLESTKNEALGKVENQLQKLQALHHHAVLYEQSLIPNAKRNVSASQSDYAENKTPFQNVLSSRLNLWAIEATYHQHLTDYQIALAELESLVGSDLRFFGRTPNGLSK